MISVTVRLPEEWHRALVALAEWENRSVSGEIRRAIRCHLTEQPEPITNSVPGELNLVDVQDAETGERFIVDSRLLVGPEVTVHPDECQELWERPYLYDREREGWLS